MDVLFQAIIATLIVSLISLVGVFSLLISHKFLKKLLFFLVAFSAGTLMGGAFFHLIPEAIDQKGVQFAFIFVVVGFALFFLIERILKWRHCHEGHCDVHSFTYMSLIGDAIHNLIDGLLIAVSFSADFRLGMATTFAIIAHEIPQELGDFAVLIYGGFSKLKALFFNFLTALTAVVGAVIGVFLTNHVENFSMFLIPFAAGGFIYIFASDLIPELHKEEDLTKSLISFLMFIIGIVFMFVSKLMLE